MAVEWRGPQILDVIDQRVNASMLALGRKVVAEAVRFAPKKTGRLATSLTFDYNLSTKTLVFTSDVPYDIFQEYGTRNMLPHPHWRPAINLAGQIYGFNLEMAFANVPHIRDPLLASGPGFHVPKNLTAKQMEHVRHGLKPISKRLWEDKGGFGNVGRTKMHVRKHF